MPRPIRIEFSDAFYWISSRTNAETPTLKKGALAELFIQTLKDCVSHFGLNLYAYSISPTGYDLFLQAPRNNLTESIGWLQTTSTIRINRFNRSIGHVFSGRYKSILISPELYAKKVITSIHLTPFTQSMGVTLPDNVLDRLSDYPYSSHISYCRGQERLDYLTYDFLTDFTDVNDSAQMDYESMMKAWAQEGKIPDFRSELRASLVLGSDELLNRVREEISHKSGIMESKWLRTDASKQRAEQIARLIPADTQRDIQIWLRAKIGGERPTQLALEFGFSDASGITHLLKNLEQKQKKDELFAGQIAALTKNLSEGISTRGIPTINTTKPAPAQPKMSTTRHQGKQFVPVKNVLESMPQQPAPPDEESNLSVVLL